MVPILLDPRSIAKALSDDFDLPFRLKALGNSAKIEVRIPGIDFPNGFRIIISRGLAHVYADLELDSLAGSLLRKIYVDKKDAPIDLATQEIAAEKSGVRLTLSINGDRANLAAPLTVSRPWSMLSISGQKLQEQAAESDASLVAGVVLCVMMEFLDIEPDSVHENEIVDSASFEIEGALSYALTKKYERSRKNRALALFIHGRTCKVCGFNFREVYGEQVGDYIEVHHINPVHTFDSPRVVDVGSELIPVCANCHRAAHRRYPPFSPTELQEAIKTELKTEQGGLM